MSWFAVHASELPWRATGNPYHVLVSEFMLQQTQRERVRQKYMEFIARFPTVEGLAAASRAEVIRAWAGLGYNHRALRLQAAARAIIAPAEHPPSDVTALRRLPGVGPYTAGAIACFGYGIQVAFVDTNVRRVLRRVFLGETQPQPRPALDNELARSALPAGHAVAWNSALMDLGALICRARAPRCGECPLSSLCEARSHLEQAIGTPAALMHRQVAEERQAYGERATKPTTPWRNSDRYLRGRIVQALRELPTGAALRVEELAHATGVSALPPDDRLPGLAEKLASEGLIHASGEGRERRYRLPD